MDKRRSNSLFLMMMVLLLIFGLVLLFWGASTYVKPRVPFGGPPVNLRTMMTGEYFT